MRNSAVSGAHVLEEPARVLAVAGWSGVGKTTLICRLIPELQAHGLRVSTIKHAHEGFELDRRGKDSFQHREAGAQEVLVMSPRRWVLLHEMRPGDDEFDVMEAAAKLSPVDLVLVEGFKGIGLPTIEVRRAVPGKPALLIPRASRIAIVTDDAVAGRDCPVVSPSHPGRLARHILDWMRWETAR